MRLSRLWFILLVLLVACTKPPARGDQTAALSKSHGAAALSSRPAVTLSTSTTSSSIVVSPPPNSTAATILVTTWCHVVVRAEPTIVSRCSQTPEDRKLCVRTPDPYASDLASMINGTMITPPVYTCTGKGFLATLDFRNLGDTPTCINEGGIAGKSRPCSQGIRNTPDYHTPTLPGWRPKEGDALYVLCQQVGDNILGGGFLRNDQLWYSNIWDEVVNKTTGSIGYISDLWLGNRGWRGVDCSTI
jgi:hypothetical protein